MNPWHPTPAESEQTTEEREYDEREMGEGDQVSENSVKHCKTPPSEGKIRLWPPNGIGLHPHRTVLAFNAGTQPPAARTLPKVDGDARWPISIRQAPVI
jgi:hypothetical protein